MSTRVGFGYDVHRLVPERPMRIACVELPSDRGPLGHSDGDVVAHAVADALLSAAGLDDIGTHFPPGDPQWAGAPGSLLLSETRLRLQAVGARPVHVDVTVVTEAPKIAPYRTEMRRAVAEALSLDPSQVGIKGRSHEGIGEIGRGEAIAAYAVVLVELTVP
jgi:2-C-methyl-D-erythritol 2,4-cyclodiphosphate synthase